MNDLAGRRPLKVRELTLMTNITKWLSKKDITPNQISIASVFFALFAGTVLLVVNSGGSIWLMWLAALFIQCRLLCNLFDGMVAMEGGKSTASGELFNDIPDRIADPLILVPAGYLLTGFSWGAELGWLAGILAVMTAYVRTLASSMGAPTLFTGPMAKQHRMALITIALLLSPLEHLLFSTPGYLLLMVLVIICLGSLTTIYNRTRDAYLYLESPKKELDHPKGSEHV